MKGKVIELALESGLAYEMKNGMYWIDAGPIDIHLERFYEMAFEAGRMVGFKQDKALTELARIGQEIEQAHTDHPMRHWDRTCPACVSESANSTKPVVESESSFALQEPVACKHKRYSNDVTEDIATCYDCGAEGRMRFVANDTSPPQAEKQFNPDWDQQAVLVERIRELEAQLYGQAEKQEPESYDETSWQMGYWAGKNANVNDFIRDECDRLVMPERTPRKEWVGMTSQEVDEIREQIFQEHTTALLNNKEINEKNDYGAWNFYQRIESKLKERNK